MELERLAMMRQFEDEYKESPYICGIDEVGRGPLCGPVVASAVILPKDAQILYINDSKKLSEKKREALFDKIKYESLAYSIGIATPQEIDEVNILQATFLAMRRAVMFFFDFGVNGIELKNSASFSPGSFAI